jgi:hypothetical protein
MLERAKPALKGWSPPAPGLMVTAASSILMLKNYASIPFVMTGFHPV